VVRTIAADCDLTGARPRSVCRVKGHSQRFVYEGMAK
jgi:hypothetical protein